MTRHYGAGALLAHAYLPDADAGLARHLDDCESCRKRLAGIRSELERHVSDSSAPESPETFWKRQELAVMRTIERRGRRTPRVATQIAAAAALLIVVAAFLVGRETVSPEITPTLTATVASTAATATPAAQENGLTTSQITTDPWQSEQLQDFQTVVDWETWVEDDGKSRGTI